jgi:GH24 family phage-related lysozyme (muramidase)
MRTLSKAGVNLIKKWEGYHTLLPGGDCRAYLDRLARPHVWTIGYGCTEGIHEGLVWTEEEAELALRKELAGKERWVNRLVTVPISQAHFDALVSFAYNLGEGNLRRSTLLRKLNRKDYDGAEDEFKRWVYAGGKRYRGLVRRRKDEARMFAEGTIALFDDPDEDDPLWWEADEAAMPQIPEVQAKPVTPPVATAAGVAAAGASSAVAMQQQAPDTWSVFTKLGASLASFATGNWLTVSIILCAMLVFWMVPYLVKSWPRKRWL